MISVTVTPKELSFLKEWADSQNLGKTIPVPSSIGFERFCELVQRQVRQCSECDTIIVGHFWVDWPLCKKCEEND